MGNNLVFQPPDCSYHHKEFTGELLWVPRGRAQLMHGIPCMLLQEPTAACMLVFFHANAEDLGQIYVMLRYFRTFLKVHVLAVEYPGYGLCSGSPSIGAVLKDAERVLDFVYRKLDVPLERVLVVGRSMGGCPAMHLASSFAVGGLVTLSAFSSLAELVGPPDSLQHMVVSTMSNFLGDYNNARRMRSVACPTLIVHGSEDDVVEVEHAYTLESEWGVDVEDDLSDELCQVNIREGVGHNDLDNKQDIIGPIRAMFPDLLQGEPLELTRAADFLAQQPQSFAGDVQARAPFPHNWEPHMLPHIKTTFISLDGEEI